MEGLRLVSMTRKYVGSGLSRLALASGIEAAHCFSHRL